MPPISASTRNTMPKRHLQSSATVNTPPTAPSEDYRTKLAQLSLELNQHLAQHAKRVGDSLNGRGVPSRTPSVGTPQRLENFMDHYLPANERRDERSKSPASARSRSAPRDISVASYLPSRASSIGRQASVKTCTVLYKFEGHGARELSVNKGDVVRLNRVVNDSWLEGERNGQVGIIPVSYVQFDEEEGATVRGKELLALFDFQARNDNELSMKKVCWDWILKILLLSCPCWALFCPCWALFCPCRALFCPCWALFCPCWALFCPCWALFCPCWALFCPCWPCSALVGLSASLVLTPIHALSG
jgi:hypothetical protein